MFGIFLGLFDRFICLIMWLLFLFFVFLFCRFIYIFYFCGVDFLFYFGFYLLCFGCMLFFVVNSLIMMIKNYYFLDFKVGEWVEF